MKLFQHADFEQAVLQAAEHFRARRLRPVVIEKDYYVTEALRSIAAADDLCSTGSFEFWRMTGKSRNTSFCIVHSNSDHSKENIDSYLVTQNNRGLSLITRLPSTSFRSPYFALFR